MKHPLCACRGGCAYDLGVRGRNDVEPPPDSWTIANYRRQDVYDKGQNTIAANPTSTSPLLRFSDLFTLGYGCVPFRNSRPQVAHGHLQHLYALAFYQ